MKHKKLIAFLSGVTVVILVALSIVSDASTISSKGSVIEEENDINLGALQAPPLGGGGSSCDEYVYVKQWGRGPLPWLNGKLRHPYGIHVDNSDVIYVADSGNYRVQKFTSNGDYLSKWGTKGSGNGQFNFPIGVATNSTGEFAYVLDFTNNNVQKFTSNGDYLLKWGGPGSLEGKFSGPRGITVDEFGNVYVIDTGNRRVQKFDADGKFLDMWTHVDFRLPTGIDIDIPGYVYVTDSKTQNFKKFDPISHTVLNDEDLPTSPPLQVATDPRDLAVDDSGDIFITDIAHEIVLKFMFKQNDYFFFTFFGGPGSGDGQFNDPRGVDVDSQGNVYIADEGNNRVQKFKPDCAKIVIRKEFVNEPQQDVNFEFFRNFGDNFYLNASPQIGTNEIVFPVLPNSPGTFYTVTEILRGYGLYRIDCVDPSGGTTVDVANETASISVSGNETITCTFINQLID